MRLAAQCRTALSSLSMKRHLHTSVSLRKGVAQRRQAELDNDEVAFDVDDLLQAFKGQKARNESSSAGHLKMRQARHLLDYLRLIEQLTPELVALRIPFSPPTSDTPLIVRSVEYVGEDHPAAIKQTVVVPVAQLPLRNKVALHKFKILAGVRWTPDPPKNAGVGPNETGREHGYIKISCEDFPDPAQNLKWASDMIDRLIAEANTGKKFMDVPQDTRHLVAKVRKAKLGDHRSGHIFHRPSIKDFPKEWLPEPNKPLIVPEDTELNAGSQ